MRSLSVARLRARHGDGGTGDGHVGVQLCVGEVAAEVCGGLASGLLFSGS